MRELETYLENPPVGLQGIVEIFNLSLSVKDRLLSEKKWSGMQGDRRSEYPSIAQFITRMALREGPSLYEEIRNVMPFNPSHCTQKKYWRHNGIFSGIRPGILRENHLSKALSTVTHIKEVSS